MQFNFIEFRESYNLIPMNIPDKDNYYLDLNNISNSMTGRLDILIIANAFIQEAVQLVINAIALFERGYFDCAYYSLRQSIEVSTTLVYLSELDCDEREEELSKWKQKSKFPMFRDMLIFLKNNSDVFSDMHKQMIDYFDELQKKKKLLNKYIHKQGFNTFYFSRKNNINRNNNAFTNVFKNHLNTCIGAIAVLRLVIDPFPILLMDHEIYIRTEDMLTEAYTAEFVDKYIGNSYIESYKKTDIYKSHYNLYINKEAKLPCVVDLVKYQFIDRRKIQEILSQKHLISKSDLVAVLIFKYSEEIAMIFCDGGFTFYNSNTNSLRKNQGFDGRVFLEVKKSSLLINYVYEEAYLSYILFEGEDYFIEHNKKFTEKEIIELKEMLDV